MKKRLLLLGVLWISAVSVSGCVVLDRHGRVNPGATAVANGLLIGAGVVGLGIAAHEAELREEVIYEHSHRSHRVRRSDHRGDHRHSRCRTVRTWRH